MIKPKFIIIPMCVGFFLSFVVGLISGVFFGIVILRAVIFAILFGGLGFGIGLLFQRFLLEPSDMDVGVDVSTSSHQGSVVDISIGDEPLVEDENGPDFYVRKDLPSSGQVIQAEKSSIPTSDSQVSEESKTFSQENSQEQFRPISLGTPMGQEKTAESASNGPVHAAASTDVLPDIGDISVASTNVDSDVSSGGMDLAIGNGMETSQGRGRADSSSDSQTIAQAIRTVLARDS